MAFMHYPPLDKIDWDDLASSTVGDLVLCAPVLEELDRNKDQHPQSGVRRRLRKLLGWIGDGLSEDDTVNVRDGLRLRVMLDAPEGVDFGGLRGDRADDHVVALCAYLNAAEPGSAAIVSNDTMVRIRARKLGLTIVRLPDSLRFKEPDETQRKLDEIRREQLRKPRFVVAFADETSNVKSVELPMVRPYVSDEAMLNMEALFDKGRRDELEEYHKAQREHEVVTKRLIPIGFGIKNVGDAAATSLKIRLGKPTVGRLYQEDQLPQAPDKPLSPFEIISSTSRLRHLSGLAESGDVRIVRAIREIGRQGSSVHIAKDGDRGLIEFVELLHDFHKSFGKLYLSLPDQEERTVEIPLAIHCAQLSEPQHLRLIVEVRNEPLAEGPKSVRQLPKELLAKIQRNQEKVGGASTSNVTHDDEPTPSVPEEPS